MDQKACYIEISNLIIAAWEIYSNLDFGPLHMENWGLIVKLVVFSSYFPFYHFPFFKTMSSFESFQVCPIFDCIFCTAFETALKISVYMLEYGGDLHVSENTKKEAKLRLGLYRNVYSYVNRVHESPTLHTYQWEKEIFVILSIWYCPFIFYPIFLQQQIQICAGGELNRILNASYEKGWLRFKKHGKLDTSLGLLYFLKILKQLLWTIACKDKVFPLTL